MYHCKLIVCRCNENLILLIKILKRVARIKNPVLLFTPLFSFLTISFFTEGVNVLTYREFSMVTSHE